MDIKVARDITLQIQLKEATAMQTLLFLSLFFAFGSSAPLDQVKCYLLHIPELNWSYMHIIQGMQGLTPTWVDICNGTYLFSEDKKSW